MDWMQGIVRDTLVNAQRFLGANAAALGPVNSSGARKALDDSVAAFDGFAVAQAEHTIGSTGETQKQRSLRRALRRRYLRPIAKVAAATLGDVPELATLRLPPLNLVGAALVDRATAMANAAEPHAAALVAGGLQPDFVAAFRAMILELRTSLGQRTDHKNVRRTSTIALANEAKMGRRALRLLDAAMQQSVTDEQLLAAWAAVRRIPKKPGASRGTQDGAQQVGTTTTTTPAPSVTVASSASTTASPVAAATATAGTAAGSQPAAA